MPSLRTIFAIAPAIFSAVNAQGVLVQAIGKAGSTPSLALGYDFKSGDAAIISAKENAQNVVNECGRSLLGGNIDIGETTETAIVAKQLTEASKGSTVTVTMRPVDDRGKGPFTCDMDQTSNTKATGQTKLEVKEKEEANGDITLSVQMPQDMACNGASTGNICTVRCFNAEKTGPFGGCFSLIQSDIKPAENDVNKIPTVQAKDSVEKQVAQNKKDFEKATKATAEAQNNDFGLKVANALLGVDSAPQATATPNADPVAPPAKDDGNNGGAAKKAGGDKDKKKDGGNDKDAKKAGGEKKKDGGNGNNGNNGNNEKAAKKAGDGGNGGNNGKPGGNNKDKDNGPGGNKPKDNGPGAKGNFPGFQPKPKDNNKRAMRVTRAWVA
ncbi:hypothetical protein HYFRA_00002617 [Hymenoscyphus fraxineus]|uniref:GEgh 16 protein n=1 Tax=Hymenoscyphus fraxineus TaxID=746836 RepID=A0A9N9L650_9HELO|nr:hypothetical protein HYFRA_00002617 [Hymenoscyphus fraxineus]